MGDLKVVAVATVVLALHLADSAGPCPTGDFETQLSYALHNELLTDEDIKNISQIFQELETVLSSRWPGTAIVPFGSLATGLALRSSDADCIAQVPRHADPAAGGHLAQEAMQMLLRRPNEYQRLHLTTTGRVPIITFYYKPKEKYCDLSFTGPTGVQNSKLINYYMHLNEKIRLVTAFLKIWAQVHAISGSGKLPSYGVAVLAIFYFQQIQLVPPISLLQQDAEPHWVGGWNTAFERLPYHTNNTQSSYELLRGFFEYYSAFNFRDYIVSIYAGRPILKSAFGRADSVPGEFAQYRRCVMARSCAPARFRIHVWVQDTFEHNNFLGYRKDPTTVSVLPYYVKYAAEMFRVLPRDKVLRAILVGQKEFEPNRKKYLSLDVISDSEHCNGTAY